VNRSSDQCENASLVRLLKQRDPDALAQLYDAYGALVYSRIYFMIHNQGVAEELVQEVFLRVWRGAKGFDETRGSVRTWLLAVAQHCGIDYLLSRESQIECKAHSLDLNPGLKSPLSVEQHADTVHLFDRIRAGVGQLNTDQRNVIKLVFEEGFTHVELANRLNRPLGTVKTQIRTALQLLRAEMLGCGNRA
jgi:RNA polymerase sigma factor (sigma-70 family)